MSSVTLGSGNNSALPLTPFTLEKGPESLCGISESRRWGDSRPCCSVFTFARVAVEGFILLSVSGQTIHLCPVALER